MRATWERHLRLALLAAGVFVAVSAQAFSLFGSDAKTRATRYLRRADETLTRADAVYEGGNVDQALVLYRRAEEAYVALCRDYADLENGLPRYRLDYCRGQIARIETLSSGEATEPAPGETAAREPAAGEASSEATTTRDEREAAPADSGAPVAETGAPFDASRELAEVRALIEADQLDEASAVLSSLLRADPGNRSVRLMIAGVRTRQGRFEEALAALEDLRGAEEDLPLLLALAGADYGAGRHFDAMLALDKAVRLAPNHPHAYVNLAWLRLAMSPGEEGRREAETYYRVAVKHGARRDWQLERRLGLQ